MNEVKSIEYRSGHVYHITFDDGLAGDVDFSGYLGRGPVFEEFRNLVFFRQARIEAGTISWPNGVDIAPETLYRTIENAQSPRPDIVELQDRSPVQ